MSEAHALEARLLAILIEVLEEEEAADFRASSNFFEDGLLDSFDLVTLIHQLEETFGVSIDGADIVPEHFMNLAALEALLAKYRVPA
jgi:acyl carrier protein